MHLAVYLPLLFSALFGVVAPASARRLPPAVATWFLSAGGLFAAVGSTMSLVLLGSTVIGRNPGLAAYGHWSDSVLGQTDPVSLPVSALALAALLTGTVRVVLAGIRRGRAVGASYRLAASFPAATGELAVIGGSGLQAFAVPGRPGRIVVTHSLLSDLSAGERRAVLAHERAHLVHRHHLHHTAARLAVALNPLLSRLAGAVSLSTERWSDEDAATVGPRATVATALARAAAGAGDEATGAAVLAVAVDHVEARIRALACPAPPLTLWRIAVLAALLLAIAATVVEASTDAEQLIDMARYAYHAGGR